ncbi:hypothetical protein KC19_1G208300 [Ceratodon purpureus]|uniref:Uncharacterized protein n=1 Tax=Ceratodon purpureus TaxID=3225 RepID=A0A8T0J7K6_CERPU|nr:hypothetical protein KC19_1G208300 [Ceratodon purpureus]
MCFQSSYWMFSTCLQSMLQWLCSTSLCLCCSNGEIIERKIFIALQHVLG